MKNINWIKIAGIIAVTGLVILSLFAFTGFIRRLPDFKINLFINLVLTLSVTVSAIFYISKTNYGVIESENNTEEEV